MTGGEVGWVCMWEEREGGAVYAGTMLLLLGVAFGTVVCRSDESRRLPCQPLHLLLCMVTLVLLLLEFFCHNIF